MTSEEVLEKIEEAKANGATTLDLGWKKLTTLPLELFQLTNLTALNLRHNQLTILPSELFQLTNLTYLDLSHNQPTTLPLELFQLTNLTALNLGDNQLTILPSELFHLTSLTELDLSYNQLTCLPPEIGQLKNLTTLILSRNQLTTLPTELFQLTRLTVLILHDNQLTCLPPEIGQLKNLQAIALWGNKLTALPPELFQLASLTELDFSGNQLTALPLEICQLTSLIALDLSYNPLISPPLEIANQGIYAIRQYFAELEKNKQPLNEAKIILVGDGAAGKTSLVKQFLGEAFNQHEDTTHGISIRGWEPHCGGKQIKINLWDFGGQEIMHATHKFFLSKRSVYVLVLDGRKDEKLEYWLRHIESFGGDSPVLVVLNKMDANPSFEVNRAFLREKYQGIRSFWPVSCKTGEGMGQLRAALLKELAQVEMIGTLWPGTWFKVKRRLEQMQEPYISYETYESYCQEAGIVEPESREVLVDFLHDLGVAVHFKDFELNCFNVLDPKWVTHGVYTIINAKQVADGKGILHIDSLKDILKTQAPSLADHLKEGFGLGVQESYSYGLQTHRYLLDLMKKFELCWELDTERVLIPQLLGVAEPDFAFDYVGSLRFALHYPDFLPLSVLPRFMVKLHRQIKGDLRWRTGVVLKDDGSETLAAVKADEEKRRINLWVSGPRRREYLHYLRYTLADINSGFEKLAVSERVPMPDAPQATADYETLLNLAEAGSDIFIPDGSKTRYSVHELLGLVQPKDKAELVGLAEKVAPQDEGGESAAGILNGLVEPKITVLGITFNMQWLFDKLLEYDKRRKREARR